MKAPRRAAPGLALGAVLALAGWTAGSCRGTPPAPAPVDEAPATQAAAPCAPVQGELAAGTNASSLAGGFRLSMVATQGSRAGSTATGSLRLRPFGSAPVPVPAAQGTRFPLFGGTDVPLADVGAIAPGDVKRDDAAAPGVLAIESALNGRADVMLRLGSDANHGDQMRFDGARTVLFVRSITPGRFAGRWESGAGTTRTGGHFCADRV